MMQRVIYKGDVKGSYNILPFSNLMGDFGGKPVPEAFMSLNNGKRRCAWIMPDSYVVGIEYLPVGGNNYKTIAVVMGKEEKEVRDLEKKIRDAIAKLDENLFRTKGRNA